MIALVEQAGKAMFPDGSTRHFKHLIVKADGSLMPAVIDLKSMKVVPLDGFKSVVSIGDYCDNLLRNHQSSTQAH
jgi:hypothetical protein